ncbi:MAG: hypothetical protein HYX79_07005 [Chloroflexi bacterium]|nr:hypothetical protein [Chloroflexota bacterium]
MRVLIDTNILISREDARLIPTNIQELLSVLQRIGAEILVHPLSVEELKRDSNKQRRDIVLSKVRTYPFLQKPPVPTNDTEFLQALKSEQRNDNEDTDNAILYAVYKDSVHFLVTEDRGIHKKARRVGLEDRVLLADDALAVFERFLEGQKLMSPTPLQENYVYNLNLGDPIFNSLRGEYGESEFDDWFRRISQEGRKCLVHFREDGAIGALLIYKIEDEAIDSDPPLEKRMRLKLSTFKVTLVGQKLGELLVKLSTDIAIKNGLSEVYLTHFTLPEDRLTELISDFGFYKAAVNRRGEDIFLKKLVPEDGEHVGLSPLETAKRFYPSFYDGVAVQKFIVPIRPEYHDRLFTTFPNRQITLAEHAGEFIIEGNTIKKAYISHARTSRMQGGDIVLFYLSKHKIITSIGVVETVHHGLQNADEIIKQVGKRTVYSRLEIEEIAKRPTTVILFRHHFHLKTPLRFKQLQAFGLLKGPPQSIVQIADEIYAKIKREGGIDERFTIH